MFFIPLGLAALQLLLDDEAELVRNPVVALIAGAVLHPVTVLPFLMTSRIDWHVWGMVGVAIWQWAWLFLGTSSKPHKVNNFVGEEWPGVGLAALFAALCMLAMVSDAGVMRHFALQVIAVSAFDQGWPPASPFVAGFPHRDNFGVHISILAIHKAIGGALRDLGGHGAQVMYLFLAANALLFASRHLMRLSRDAAILAMLAAFCIIYFPPIFWRVGLHSYPSSATMTLSPLLGSSAFLLSLCVMASVPHGADRPRRRELGRLAGFFVLGFAAFLARANAGALPAGSMAAFWFVKAARDLSPQWSLFARVFVLGAGAIAALATTLGMPVGGGFSGSRFLKTNSFETFQYLGDLNVLHVANLLRGLGATSTGAGGAAYVVGVLFGAGFLSLAFWYGQLSEVRRRRDDRETLLLIAAALGVAATAATFAEGGSNFVFLQLARLCLCILGAWALGMVFRDGIPGVEADRARRLVAAGTITLCVVQVADSAFSFVRAKGPGNAFARIDWERVLLAGRPALSIEGLTPLIDARQDRILIVDDGKRLSYLHGELWMSQYGYKLVADAQKVRIFAGFGGPHRDRLGKVGSLLSRLYAKARNGQLDAAAAASIAKLQANSKGSIHLLASRHLEMPEPLPQGAEMVGANADLVLIRLASGSGR